MKKSAPAVNGDWSVLSELFFRFMDLPNEVDEPFARLRDSLLGPIGELELSNCSRLAILHCEHNKNNIIIIIIILIIMIITMIIIT